MSNAILQHYVPQLILRNFLAADGKVEVMERGNDRTWRSGPDGVACERYYNATRRDDGTLDTQSVERRLWEVEDKAAPLIQEILAGTTHFEKDCDSLAQFIAVQDFRSPRKRQEYADALLAFEHHKIGEGGQISASSMLERVRIACANPSRLNSGLDFSDSRLRMDEYGSVHVSREDTVIALNAALEFAPVIAGMDWTLFRANTASPFIISDSPVVLWEDPRTLPPGTGPGYWRAGTSVSMPLSSTITLVATHSMGKFAVRDLQQMKRIGSQPATGRDVKFFNQLQMQSAYRFLYAANSNDGLCRKVAGMQPRKTTIAFAPVDADGKPISPRLIRAR